MPRPRLGLSALLLILTLIAARPAAACPNCKEALSAQPADSARLAEGFNWSILVMLGVPFSIVSVGGLAVRRAVRRGVLPEF